MSTLEVGKIVPATGTAITLGESGDTLTVPSGGNLTVASGATINITGATQTGFPESLNNKPAFLAVLSANRTITDVTTTNAECNTELLDTDGLYDNSTNYRFTVTAGTVGWYWISGSAEVAFGTNEAGYLRVMIYRNGVEYYTSYQNMTSNAANTYGLTASGIVDLTTADDYVELFIRADDQSGNPQLNGKGSNTFVGTYFNGYKLAGGT